MYRVLVLLFLSFFIFTGVHGQSYNEWVEQSFKNIKENDYAAAENALLQALRKEPANAQNVMLLSNLGTVQRKLNKNDAALQSYTNALMMSPRSVTLLMNRAALLSEMNRMDSALDDYNQVLLLDNDMEDALYLRGLIRLEKGDTLACRKDIEQLLRLNPRSSDGRIGMASLLKARKYYNDAIDLYNQVIKLNPKRGDLYIGRAEAYYYDRKLTKADEDIAKALELDDADPLAYVLRGKVKLARYERKEAAKDFEKAVSLGFEQKVVDELMKD